MTARWRMIGLSVVAIVTAAATLSAAPVVAAQTNCPAVEAIAVPGTSQTTPAADPNEPVGVLGSILEPMAKRLKLAISTYYVPYPASIIGGTDGGGYRASKNAGIDHTNARITQVANRCPKTNFMLTGYSQGADIVGDIASAIGRGTGVIPSARVIGVALVADPSQSPIGQPTIGLNKPGMGFAGVRRDGFGSLLANNGVLSLCDPKDYYCSLPQGDTVMRFIGHLGSQLDAADPAGSAQRLATIFMAGLIAPAAQAITQILSLVRDPQLIPNLVSRGVAFAQALTKQLFWLAGPQVAAAAADLVNTATQVVGLIRSRQWTALPGLIASVATKATTVGSALTQMQKNTATINTSGFAGVGSSMAQPSTMNITNLATALLNAISTASGGIGTKSLGMFGPTYSQFTAANVTSALKHFAQFIQGGYHSNYDRRPLDSAGHTGVQIAQRYFVNQLSKMA